MKITNIKSFPTWVGNRNQLIIKVETDQGLVGWGESGLSGRERAVMGAIDHFREFLIGKDPMQTGRIWQELYRSQYFEGGRVLLAAQSAIDIALYDIKGKALGVPVYELLGGKHRDVIPCFATASGHGQKLIEDVKLLMSNGWTVIRTAPMMPSTPGAFNRGGFINGSDVFEPRESIALTAKWLTKVREECGSEICWASTITIA